MKLWVTIFVFLFGTAFASFQDALDEAKDETLRELHRVLAAVPPLDGAVDGISLEWMDSEIKTEFGKLLKHTLDEAIAAVKDALAHGKKISVEWIDRIKALKETLKGFGKEVEQKVKDLLEELKAQRVEEEFAEMMEAPGGKRKFSAVSAVLAFIKKQIARKVAPEFIIKFIDKTKSILGELGRLLLEALRKGGHKALDKLIDHLQSKLPSNKDLEEEDLDLQEFQSDIHYGVISDIFSSLKNKIKEKWSSDEIQNYIKKAKVQLGELARVLLEALRKGGHIALDETIDRLKEQLPAYVMHRQMLIMEAEVQRGTMINDIFNNLKDAILKKVTTDEIQVYIEKMKGVLGEVARELLEALRRGGHKALDQLIDRLQDKLPRPEESFSPAAPYEKWMEDFKKWLENLVEKITERVDYIKAAAIKFLEKAKDDETIKKGFHFFKHYRTVLGDLWEKILDKYQQVLRKPHQD